jgi:hypothetical protein
VDQPLLYQSWGKKQTYIFAFCADNYSLEPNLDNHAAPSGATPHEGGTQPVENPTLSIKHPIIEDVTNKYTSDEWTEICQRRDETLDLISSSVIDVENLLRTTIRERYS